MGKKLIHEGWYNTKMLTFERNSNAIVSYIPNGLTSSPVLRVIRAIWIEAAEATS